MVWWFCTCHGCVLPIKFYDYSYSLGAAPVQYLVPQHCLVSSDSLILALIWSWQDVVRMMWKSFLEENKDLILTAGMSETLLWEKWRGRWGTVHICFWGKPPQNRFALFSHPWSLPQMQWVQSVLVVASLPSNERWRSQPQKPGHHTIIALRYALRLGIKNDHCFLESEKIKQMKLLECCWCGPLEQQFSSTAGLVFTPWVSSHRAGRVVGRRDIPGHTTLYE